MSNVNFSNEIRKDAEAMLDKHNVLPQFKGMTVEERQEYSKADRLPYDVCLLNLTGDLNTGTIIRSAYLLGASRVWIVGRRKIDQRSTVGVENYIDIAKVGGLCEDDLTIDENVFMDVINSNPHYMPVFCETGGVTLGNFDWCSSLMNSENNEYYRPLLIFGNENRGIGDNILNLRDHLERSMTVAIPQKGVLRSFNVSSAASIMCWDLVSKMTWN
jgi:tRNA G18 (ribose-2'-O)-methylase SpoU